MPGNFDSKTCCFICGKARDRKGVHKLLLVTMKDRERNIWRKANELEDDAMIARLRGLDGGCMDLITNHFQYHASCLGNYLKKKCCLRTENLSVNREGLKWLLATINEQLFEDNTIFFSGQIT